VSVIKSRVTWDRSEAAVAEAGTLNAEPIAEARPLNAKPIAGPDGPVDPEEFPYPSTVTGAVPLGAPVTVSFAAGWSGGYDGANRRHRQECQD
jgi:hypothetical protein